MRFNDYDIFFQMKRSLSLISYRTIPRLILSNRILPYRIIWYQIWTYSKSFRDIDMVYVSHSPHIMADANLSTPWPLE